MKLSSNISFPPTEAACDAISDFKSETTNFAQFVINGADEVIDSVTSQSGVTLDGVDGLVPRDRATYNLYRVPASAADGFINDNPVIFLHGISSEFMTIVLFPPYFTIHLLPLNWRIRIAITCRS